MKTLEVKYRKTTFDFWYRCHNGNTVTPWQWGGVTREKCIAAAQARFGADYKPAKEGV